MLPQFLYRGDSDPNSKRQLKSTFNSGLLLTNLISGGNGTEIFNSSIVQLVNRHIATGWDKTHFLSFTTNENVAFHYGNNDKTFDEVYDETPNWDFVVFTFDTTNLLQDSIKEISTGIFAAQFLPICKEFLPSYKMILIDTLTHLKSIANKSAIDLTTAVEKAERDSEWLVLPASPFGHSGEFTAKFDSACITDKRIFRYE